MKPLAHVMILASAGSGKTYALTNRFVELLVRGAPAERIVALTFTRKAAGEFFDEILNKLARAAREPAYGRRLAAEVAGEGTAPVPVDFLALLRQVADVMHRLRLGTLDSFFGRIARTFPLELGLAGEFELLEEHAARLERQRVLRRMFARKGELDAAQREFIEAFKRATFGAEEKRLGPRLDSFLDAHQEHFLAAPDADGWGNPARIWPDGNAWLEAKIDRVAAAEALSAWVESAPIEPKQRDRWRAFLAGLAEWMPGINPSRPIEYVLVKTLDAWPAVLAGTAVLEFDRRRQQLTPDACRALADLTRHVFGGELWRRVATTRGIHAVLRGYDQVYHDLVRRTGKLTFADVQRLLVPVVLTRTEATREDDPEDGDTATAESGQLALAFGTGPEETDRLFIDYRLDAEFDHWLLDEFQDTSRGQWSVLQNLIDEVIQDASGTRSFFCVGDVKQAIYTWREGDPRLFREIFEHYNRAAPGRIETRHLDASQRSGPAVIELVNAVFGRAEAIGGLFPGPAATNWNREWRAHTTAVPARTGQAAVLLAKNEEERWRCVVDLLLELRPLERGLTCAVLVPENSTATELADYLRREAGMPAMAESDLHVCTDNPLGAALLALVQAAAHPGDTLAWQHVQMTPLRELLNAEGITTREDAAERLLREIHTDGFERTMERWLRKLEARLAPADAFSRIRARQFVAAAARYDAAGSRDVAEFIAFMERHVVREPESTAVIRVMTIHKSKGLGFDVVILPDLQGSRIDERREGLAVQKSADGVVDWILDLPPKMFCAADDVLSRHVAVAEAEACYEALSLLYVAFTRAKRAAYVIVEPVGKSTSRNYPRLLTEALGDSTMHVRIGALSVPGIWVSGQSDEAKVGANAIDHADWIASVAPPADSAAAAERTALPLPAKIDEATARRARRLIARRPSGEGSAALMTAQLFALDRAAGAEFGAAVHALLAEVEWLEPDSVPGFEARWRQRNERPEVIAEAIRCLHAPELAAIWRRPGTRAELWRERAFEIARDESWVSGVFDRVTIERDSRTGQAVRASVYDFKTDRVDDGRGHAAAVARHATQLNVYREVAAVLASLPLDAVRCELVFTATARAYPVPPQQNRLDTARGAEHVDRS